MGQGRESENLIYLWQLRFLYMEMRWWGGSGVCFRQVNSAGRQNGKVLLNYFKQTIYSSTAGPPMITEKRPTETVEAFVYEQGIANI